LRAASCSFNAASFAKANWGSIGRSRSRVRRWWRIADATDRYHRGRLSRPPKSRPPLSRPLPPRSFVAIAAEFFRTAPAAAAALVVAVLAALAFKAFARRTTRGPGAHPRAVRRAGGTLDAGVAATSAGAPWGLRKSR